MQRQKQKASKLLQTTKKSKRQGRTPTPTQNNKQQASPQQKLCLADGRRRYEGDRRGHSLVHWNNNNHEAIHPISGCNTLGIGCRRPCRRLQSSLQGGGSCRSLGEQGEISSMACMTAMNARDRRHHCCRQMYLIFLINPPHPFIQL